MITQIPALQFMHRICGTYESQNGLARMMVLRVGHGLALEFRDDGQVQFAAVVGASGNAIRLYAQFGLPSVISLHGNLLSASQLQFECSEQAVFLAITSNGTSLDFTICIHGSQSSVTMQKV